MHLIHLPPLQRAAEHLPEAFAEMLWHEGVDDGVETGVGVGHKVWEDAEDIGGVVERESAQPHAEDYQVMGKPAKAEESSDYDDHLGDFPLGPPRLGHVLQGAHAGPQVSDGAGVGEAEHQHGNEVAEDKRAHIHYDARFGLPCRNAHNSASQVHLWEVAEIRSRENQGQGPEEADGGECVLWRPHLSGAERVANG